MSTDRVNSSSTIRVLWTPMHLKELEKAFPEDVSITTTENMFYRLGQRSVVKHIEMLVQRQLKDDKH